MLGHEFSSRIASNNTYFIIGKQPFLRLDEFHVHQNSGHPNVDNGKNDDDGDDDDDSDDDDGDDDGDDDHRDDDYDIRDDSRPQQLFSAFSDSLLFMI